MHVLLLTFWSRQQLFLRRMGRNNPLYPLCDSLWNTLCWWWAWFISSSSIPDVSYCASSLSESITILRIWFRDSSWARLAHVAFCEQKHSHHLQQQTLNCIQTIICKPVNGKPACPFYSLYPGASEPKRLYDLNMPLAKCKNNIPAQRILRT